MKKKHRIKKTINYKIDLKQLRRLQGYRQKDIQHFEQASVSKIESRLDLKLSTLIRYLDCIDMDLELRALSRPHEEEEQKIIMLLSTREE